MNSPVFLLDTNILVQAHRQYYPFDLSPAFWDALIREHGKGRIFSISIVKHEICRSHPKQGEDDKEPDVPDLLEQWVRTAVPDSFFLEPDDAAITKYRTVMQWVVSQTRYSEAEQARFASGADGWLIAYASVHGMIVVTHEKPEPTGSKVKIPDVCRQFDVSYANTFEMLRRLKVRFVLQ